MRALRVLYLGFLGSAVLGFLALLTPYAVRGQDSPHQASSETPALGHEHHAQKHAAEPSPAEGGVDDRMTAEVGVDERLGERVPLDIVLSDEQARQRRLGELITKPTLLLPVYYSCPTVCTIMLANLAGAINRVPLQLGDDYAVIALSFDEEDGPELARKTKSNYTKSLKPGMPVEAWSFVTGDEASIRSVTDAIGFKFRRTDQNLFVHPNVLVALAPDGTVIRYLYGPNFLPFDIGMALTEAAKGTPSLTIRKLLTYCFDYDAESKSYVFRSFRIMAVGILAMLLVFFFFVLRKGNRTS